VKNLIYVIIIWRCYRVASYIIIYIYILYIWACMWRCFQCLPSSSCHHKNTQVYVFLSFSHELNTFISLAATTPHEFLITGDFNLHLDHPNDSQVKQFLAALESTNLTQHSSRSSYPWSCNYYSQFLLSQSPHWSLTRFSFWSLTYFLFSFNLAKYSSAFNSNFLSLLQIYKCFEIHSRHSSF